MLEGVLEESGEVFIMEDAVADCEESGALNSSEIGEGSVVIKSMLVIVMLRELCVVDHVPGVVVAGGQEVGADGSWSRSEAAGNLVEPEEKLLSWSLADGGLGSVFSDGAPEDVGSDTPGDVDDSQHDVVLVFTVYISCCLPTLGRESTA